MGVGVRRRAGKGICSRRAKLRSKPVSACVPNRTGLNDLKPFHILKR